MPSARRERQAGKGGSKGGTGAVWGSAHPGSVHLLWGSDWGRAWLLPVRAKGAPEHRLSGVQGL